MQSLVDASSKREGADESAPSLQPEGRLFVVCYGEFIAGLQRANVALDRKTLAALAIDDPDMFTQIVELARKHLPKATATA